VLVPIGPRNGGVNKLFLLGSVRYNPISFGLGWMRAGLEILVALSNVGCRGKRCCFFFGISN
jgi:hypothetical protein